MQGPNPSAFPYFYHTLLHTSQHAFASQALEAAKRTSVHVNMSRSACLPAGSKEHMSGRLTDIWLHAALLLLPLPIFNGVLLGLVYHYQVLQEPQVSSNSDLATYGKDADAYYVNISATLLVFIASWSSTLAPVLVGSIATLASYVAARQTLSSQLRGDASRLTTPYQLAILISLLASGSVGALWQWTKYLVGWRKQRQRQGTALVNTGVIVAIASFFRYEYADKGANRISNLAD
jgi:hypothetical protein